MRDDARDWRDLASRRGLAAGGPTAMIDRADILAKITATAPPGARLDDAILARLRELSAALVAVSADSLAEFRRYLSVMDRGIVMPDQLVAGLLAGRTVLVTGASGCIGSALLGQL